MEKIDVTIKKVDVLPLVKHYIEELNLFSVFQRYIPKPPNCEVEPAQVLCVMLANIICAQKPLYKIEEWVSEYTDGLNRAGINASKYNDDRLGRETDRLYDADRKSMMTEISANAINVHSLETEKIHNDSTSVTFKGAYKNSEKSDGVRLTNGFNKDHRDFGIDFEKIGYTEERYRVFSKKGRHDL